jgi:hypothetical protein
VNFIVPTHTALSFHTEGSRIDFTLRGALTPRDSAIAPAVARFGPWASSRALQAVRLLQVAVPISAIRHASPLFTARGGIL